MRYFPLGYRSNKTLNKWFQSISWLNTKTLPRILWASIWGNFEICSSIAFWLLLGDILLDPARTNHFSYSRKSPSLEVASVSSVVTRLCSWGFRLGWENSDFLIQYHWRHNWEMRLWAVLTEQNWWIVDKRKRTNFVQQRNATTRHRPVTDEHMAMPFKDNITFGLHVGL